MNANALFALLVLLLPGYAAIGANGQVAQKAQAVPIGSAIIASPSQAVPSHPTTPPMAGVEARASAVPPGRQDRISLQTTLSHTAYNESAPTQLLVKVEFANASPAPSNRPPLNIALVLDRSGSMADDMKFPHALAAARAVIENLTDRDFISLIAFNESALVLSPAGRVVNKPFLFQRLAEVSPGGITDLSAGLLEGIAQVNSQGATGQVKQVLLLTDGQANTGVTDPDALRRLAEAAHTKGVGISTLGCGADFNQSLLTDLATSGGGRYTYVKSAEQLPAAFKAELHGLLAVIAQNVRLEISVKGGALSKVYGRPSQPATASQQFQIGNFRAGEHGSVMMALKPAEFQPGAAVEVSARLTYDSPESTERVTHAATGQAMFAAAGSDVKAEENEAVILCAGVMDAMDSAMSALQNFDLDRYTKARASFDQWHGRVRQYALARHDQDLLNEAFLLKHFMEELQAIRGPDAPPLLGDTMRQLEKQSDYQSYQLLHHDLAQSTPVKPVEKTP